MAEVVSRVPRMGNDTMDIEPLAESVRQQVARACSELPGGSELEQLRNFCGRTWDILHTPAWASLHRHWILEGPYAPGPARGCVSEVADVVFRTLATIIERGVRAGRFRPVAPSPAARLVLATLVTQATWCMRADAPSPALASNCNRVVSDTLSILLGGLLPSEHPSSAETS